MTDKIKKFIEDIKEILPEHRVRETLWNWIQFGGGGSLLEGFVYKHRLTKKEIKNYLISEK